MRPQVISRGARGGSTPDRRTAATGQPPGARKFSLTASTQPTGGASKEATVVLRAEPDPVSQIFACERHPRPASGLIRGDRDLAALGVAILRGGLGDALALAPVLSLAGVGGALARAVTLALVDALTLHRAARLLVRLALRERRTETNIEAMAAARTAFFIDMGSSRKGLWTASWSTLSRPNVTGAEARKSAMPICNRTPHARSSLYGLRRHHREARHPPRSRNR